MNCGALAAHYLAGEAGYQTLQPTALVNEAYLKLVKQDQVDWQGRSHFFALGARPCGGSWWTTLAQRSGINEAAAGSGWS